MTAVSSIVLALFAFIQSLNVALCADFDFTECGTTKHCKGVPDNCFVRASNFDACEFVFAYAKRGNNIEMDLLGRVDPKASRQQYIAYGFSADQSMGEEPVISCLTDANGNVKTGLSRNNGRNNENFIENMEPHIRLLAASVQNGILHCKVRQDPTTNIDSNFRIDPSKSYFLLAARGKFDEASNELSYHGFDKRYVLNRQIRLADEFKANPSVRPAADAPASLPSSIVPSTRTLVKLHGLFMIVAWLLCVLLAVFTARYLRDTFGVKMNGIKLWFHVHRTLNIIAVLLIVAATISIIIATNVSWRGPWFGRNSSSNLSSSAIHSLAGALAVIFALVQPFGALFRCAPDHSKRRIFNVLHRTLGVMGVICAIIALVVALYNFRRHFASAPLLSINLLFASIVAALIAAIIAEILKARARNGAKTRVTSFELNGQHLNKQPPYKGANDPSADAFSYQQSAAGVVTGESSTHRFVNRLLFAALAAILLGCTLALVYIIE